MTNDITISQPRVVLVSMDFLVLHKMWRRSVPAGLVIVLTIWEIFCSIFVVYLYVDMVVGAEDFFTGYACGWNKRSMYRIGDFDAILSAWN